MQQITQVSCGDQYTAAATLSEVFNSSGGYFSIAGNDAFVELQYGQLGQFNTTNEAPVPVGNGILQAGTTGVRFRNLVAGSPAVVTAALYAEDEPALIITAGGLASPSSTTMVTGQVDGASGNVLAGTGFTSVRTAPGSYTVTFTPALSAAPDVIATPVIAAGGGRTISVNTITAGGFLVVTGTDAGAGADRTFNFFATPFV